MARIQAEQSGDTLQLGLQRGSHSWRDWLDWRRHDDVLFEVRTPQLNMLHASGASKVQLHDFRTTDLRLKLSGASQLSAGTLNLDNLNVDLSGASKLDISGIGAVKMEMRLSGASGAKINTLQLQMLSVHASGASHTNIAGGGSTEYLIIDASGASGYNGAKLTANQVKVNASGASHVYVQANKSLEAKTSGGSHVEYSGTPEQLDTGSSGVVVAK